MGGVKEKLPGKVTPELSRWGALEVSLADENSIFKAQKEVWGAR